MKKIFYTLSLSLLLVSCTKGFEEYNKDNSRLDKDQVVAEALLDPLIYDGNRYLVQRSFQLHGELMQYMVISSAASMNDYHRYDVKETESDVLWRNLYHWATQARYMAEAAQKDELDGIEPDRKRALRGIANIMEVLMCSNLTDIFGDMPYRQSMMTSNQILQPRYDRQQLIYDSLFVKLELANTLIGNTDKTGHDDILYHGDCQKWRKFGNSLYMRLLMRLSRRDGYADVRGTINRIYSNPTTYPLFTSIDERATLRFTGIAPNVNYYKSTTTANFETSRHASEFIMRLMLPVEDPRIDAMFTRPGAAGSDWIGVPSGCLPAEVQQKESVAAVLDGKWRQDDSSFALMNYSELKFILAEAALRGYIQTDAESLYKQGIEASCREQCDYRNYLKNYCSDATINAFVGREGVRFPSGASFNQKLEMVINQKYIAGFFVSFEAWNDYRRTGYPRLPMGNDLRNDGVLPTRLFYPNSESSRNRKNWEAALSVQGPDNMQTKLWWAE